MRGSAKRQAERKIPKRKPDVRTGPSPWDWILATLTLAVITFILWLLSQGV